MASTMAAKEHVAEIRRKKFSIGGDQNPLTEDLHQAVKNLSAELYAKDVHFLMELIQNAEDNEYSEGVDPSLEFVITSNDITKTGAPATLLVFNNEKGFSSKNIESICSVGRSTKKGLRKRGYIGEKGIGFKSVFLITAQPYIFSNGYQIRFNEKPCQFCNVGYIVPEWVEDLTLTAIKSVYGSTSLPTTTLVLPLKADKVKPVKNQLSVIHPEVLLFLSKIKRLKVREDNENPNLNTVSAISISSEKNFVTLKSMDAESYTLHLTADFTGNVDTECGYYMWKQRFPVKHENKVEVRAEVDEWVVTLAFPNGKRLNRGSTFPGIYSFLPTETVTNFPFIIQADFLLASSRENILWDSKWNKGILDCVPVAFLNSFNSLVKSTVTAPMSSLPNMFRFLPVKESSHSNLNLVQGVIKEKLMKEPIVPCESYTGQKLFCKPNEAGRLKPEFWTILNQAKSQGVSFSNISSHGSYLLTSSFDKEEYDDILNFLEIKLVENEWYSKCIGGSNLVLGVSEDVYLELLVFIAENWSSSMMYIPMIKYIGSDGRVNLFKISSCSNKVLASDSCNISWLINWNTQFHSSTGSFFLPKATQEAIESCSNKAYLKKWLEEVAKVKFVDVAEYGKLLSDSVNSDRKLAVTYAHFLYISLQNCYLQRYEVQNLCSEMPIVDNYGRVTVTRDGVLVPAKGSKWVELIGSNPWRQQNYVELGEDYTCRGSFFGNVMPEKQLVLFMKGYVGASDVPDLIPPNAAIPTMSSPLTKANALLLLRWLYNLRTSRSCSTLPERFLSSIKNGSWLKISLSGSSGYRPPSETFMLESSIGQRLQSGSALVDIPLLDVSFYGHEIKQYKEDLQTIGVRFETKDACEFISKRLMSLAASSNLTRDNVYSVLKFIRFLAANYLSSADFIDSFKEAKWLKTSRGEVEPCNSVLFSSEWSSAKEISDIPFIDDVYYGNELLSFRDELQLLGVAVSFNQNYYQLVLDNLKSSTSLTSLSSEAFNLVLKCVQKLDSSDKLVQVLKNSKCLKTNLGYRCPSECILLNPDSEWGCLLHVFKSFPILDENFYGNCTLSMSKELKIIGVMVEFEEFSKVFSRTFKQHVSTSTITKENVLSFLTCYGNLKKTKVKIPSELMICINKEKWLRTKLGDYRSPNECILFGNDWEEITPISLLPYIDDNFYGSGIHHFKEELKILGVTTEFKDGAKFVAAGIFLPQDLTSIQPLNVYALLDCIKKLTEFSMEISDKFFEKLNKKKWLKTHFGYKYPNECLLFRPSWEPYLKHNDGPFIDESVYGSRIGSYEKELNLLGVVSNIHSGCKLLATYLYSHSSFEAIARIYNYLSEFKWKPAEEDKNKIWIPRGPVNGEWVDPEDCVLHDNNDLFGDELKVLDKLDYEKKTLSFFSNIFNVKVHPSVDDYCKLWNKWENSGVQIKHAECCAFWEFVARNWNVKSEESFNAKLSKLPVFNPTSGEIILYEKCDIFIGDDLFLMDLFQSSSRPIFVWYPNPSMKFLTRTKLVEIYTKLGIRKLSESAKKLTPDDVGHVGFHLVDSKEKIIKKGLFKLILGFLSNPKFKLPAERRHEVVSRLLTLDVFETLEPMKVEYSLSFSSGDVVNVEAKRRIRWNKQNSKLFMQKMEKSCGHKNLIEYASHFAEVMADGVLWENEELVPQLAELIRLCFLVDFDDEAIEFILKTKNLEMFFEDLEYLSSIFSS